MHDNNTIEESPGAKYSAKLTEFWTRYRDHVHGPTYRFGGEWKEVFETSQYFGPPQMKQFSYTREFSAEGEYRDHML